MKYTDYVEQVPPLRVLFDFLPTVEPTEYHRPTFSPTQIPSVGCSNDAYFNPWQLAIIVGVISSAITTCGLVCAGTLCIRLRANLKRRYLRSIASSSSDREDNSSISTFSSRSNEEFVFSDVYDSFDPPV